MHQCPCTAFAGRGALQGRAPAIWHSPGPSVSDVALVGAGRQRAGHSSAIVQGTPQCPLERPWCRALVSHCAGHLSAIVQGVPQRPQSARGAGRLS
eukprot:7201997-Alexandrium_andersonii.AAC.1